MNENVQIKKQVDESLYGSWHGPGFYKLIDITHEEASKKPLPLRHTIWEITEHVAYWMNIVQKVIEGEPHPHQDESNDWPKTGVTAEEWHQTRQRLEKAQSELGEAIQNFKGDFTENIPNEDFSYNFMLEGICKHNVYHAGQLIILRETNP